MLHSRINWYSLSFPWPLLWGLSPPSFPQLRRGGTRTVFYCWQTGGVKSVWGLHALDKDLSEYSFRTLFAVVL